MPLSLTKVHIAKKDPNTNQMKVVGTNPYIRLVREGEFPISVQSGGFYTDGGDKIKPSEVPPWAIKALKACDANKLRSVGLDASILEQPSKPEPATEVPLGAVPSPELTILDAVKQLDPLNDSHWTKEGKPSIRLVSDILGRYVARDALEEATGAYRRPSTEGG